jgi:hypothetical protein
MRELRELVEQTLDRYDLGAHPPTCPCLLCAARRSLALEIDLDGMAPLRTIAEVEAWRHCQRAEDLSLLHSPQPPPGSLRRHRWEWARFRLRRER